MTPQETLHSILLDAKVRIKDGELYDDDGDKCAGICQFVEYNSTLSRELTFRGLKDFIKYTRKTMNEFDPKFNFQECYGEQYDFTDPKRLALLDWLIERTKS